MIRYKDIEFNNSIENEPRNLIIYGAPGTGKSWRINEKANKLFGQCGLYKRVTFYNQYSYNQFIGGYKPIPDFKDLGHDNIIINSLGQSVNKEPIISYEYVPGPFLMLLLRALNNEKNNYLLIIEELNRGDAASIFGDLFQILDRDKFGKSEYRIEISSDLKNYIYSTDIEESIKEDICNKGLYIPSNFYIWCTMNSADQGVFPLDSAFKRRWSFEFVGINENDKSISEYEVDIKGIGKIKWNDFRKQLNNILVKQKVNEDKLIGPFYLKPKDLTSEKFQDAFKNKLLMYLCEDCLRYKKSEVFRGETLTEILDLYNDIENNNSIFKEEIRIND